MFKFQKQHIDKLHEKYSALFAYIKLLNTEIARRSVRLEELRKKNQETKETKK